MNQYFAGHNKSGLSLNKSSLSLNPQRYTANHTPGYLWSISITLGGGAEMGANQVHCHTLNHASCCSVYWDFLPVSLHREIQGLCCTLILREHWWCPKSILNRHAKIPRQQYFPKDFGMNMDFGASTHILNFTEEETAQPQRSISCHFSTLYQKDPVSLYMLAILNIQWDQPLRCKYLSFDPSGVATFVQGRGKRQPHGCKKKNTVNGWRGCIGSTSVAKVSAKVSEKGGLQWDFAMRGLRMF
jgi:hypothetical protein